MLTPVLTKSSKLSNNDPGQYQIGDHLGMLDIVCTTLRRKNFQVGIWRRVSFSGRDASPVFIKTCV